MQETLRSRSGSLYVGVRAAFNNSISLPDRVDGGRPNLSRRDCTSTQVVLPWNHEVVIPIQALLAGRGAPVGGGGRQVAMSIVQVLPQSKLDDSRHQVTELLLRSVLQRLVLFAWDHVPWRPSSKQGPSSCRKVSRHGHVVCEKVRPTNTTFRPGRIWRHSTTERSNGASTDETWVNGRAGRDPDFAVQIPLQEEEWENQQCRETDELATQGGTTIGRPGLPSSPAALRGC